MTSKIKIKTSELVGAALDWAVAKCEGLRVEFNFQYTNDKKFNGWWQLGPNCWQPLNSYSSDWSQAGPIIEREKIATEWSSLWQSWLARDLRHAGFAFTGYTPLIAAMCCYVASKLGDEVEVPEELMQ